MALLEGSGVEGDARTDGPVHGVIKGPPQHALLAIPLQEHVQLPEVARVAPCLAPVVQEGHVGVDDSRRRGWWGLGGCIRGGVGVGIGVGGLRLLGRVGVVLVGRGTSRVRVADIAVGNRAGVCCVAMGVGIAVPTSRGQHWCRGSGGAEEQRSIHHKGRHGAATGVVERVRVE